jgi:hypothetical protein
MAQLGMTNKMSEPWQYMIALACVRWEVAAALSNQAHDANIARLPPLKLHI